MQCVYNCLPSLGFCLGLRCAFLGLHSAGDLCKLDIDSDPGLFSHSALVRPVFGTRATTLHTATSTEVKTCNVATTAFIEECRLARGMLPPKCDSEGKHSEIHQMNCEKFNVLRNVFPRPIEASLPPNGPFLLLRYTKLWAVTAHSSLFFPFTMNGMLCQHHHPSRITCITCSPKGLQEVQHPDQEVHVQMAVREISAFTELLPL